MSEDMLKILNGSLDLVGNREMTTEQLEEFILKTLQHDIKEITVRREMFNKKELENEIEINQFPFFTDGYRTGVFIQLKEDNIVVQQDEDGNDVQAKQLYKKDKDGKLILDKDGKKISTNRCYMRIKTRGGFMSLFIGLKKVEAVDEGHHYVLIGKLTTQYTVANPISDNNFDKYHKKKEDSIEYSDFPSYSFDVWQIGEATLTKSGKWKIILPECNWKKEEEEKTA